MNANSKKNNKLSASERDLLELFVLQKFKLAPENTDRTFLYSHDFIFTPEMETELTKLVKMRVDDKKPLAYILGHKEFYGRDFLCDERALIPRPETETMIEEVLDMSDIDNIYDVGTGSGCIAISLKLEEPRYEVIATDISNDALSLAKENAKKLDAGIKFIKNDLIFGLEIPEKSAIVANLPYVDSSWDWLDKKALSYEPELALFAKKNGLDLIFKLLDEVAALKKPIKVFLEADPCEHNEIISYAKKFGADYRVNDYIIILCYN